MAEFAGSKGSEDRWGEECEEEVNKVRSSGGRVRKSVGRASRVMGGVSSDIDYREWEEAATAEKKVKVLIIEIKIVSSPSEIASTSKHQAAASLRAAAPIAIAPMEN